MRKSIIDLLASALLGAAAGLGASTSARLGTTTSAFLGASAFLGTALGTSLHARRHLYIYQIKKNNVIGYS